MNSTTDTKKLNGADKQMARYLQQYLETGSIKDLANLNFYVAQVLNNKLENVDILVYKETT